jgi:mannose-6-phosphate isomerase-like protein (cupin superfamily)
MKEFIFPKIKHEQDPLLILGPAGDIFKFIRSGKSTCGKYLISETIVPPGAGPAPHVHHATDEWYYTPNGGIVVFMGQNKYQETNFNSENNTPKEVLHAINMSKNELLFVPKHHLHGYINNTNQTQLLYLIWTPDTEDVSILNYFKHVGQKITNLNNIPAVEPIAKIRFVSEAHKFGINQSHNFWQYTKAIDYSPITMDNHSQELLRLIEEGDIGSSL